MSEVKAPGDYIREELERRGWGQDDLARIVGRPKSRVNEIVLGKQAISPEIAVELGEAFGTGPEVWMSREAAYRLSLLKDGSEPIRKRALLYQLAPIKEIQKRGWIKQTDDADELEKELLRFFGTDDLSGATQVQAVFKRSSPLKDLTPVQCAWYYRVRHLAKTLKVAKFQEDRLPTCERELKKVAAYSQEARKAPVILASYGIRFVVVEPLQGGKIDGMTTWLDERSPVIAMSLRFDRIDSFWHTLCHEFRHVVHRDEFSIDTDFADPGNIPLEVRPAFERRADEEAAAMLIPPTEITSFIQRVGPLYSKERINQFANRIKMHPGIIVGQLQHRGEIAYSANREMLVKVRNAVTPVALTDGWGQTISPGVIE